MSDRFRLRLVEPLLAALETERYCRAPLLRAVLDELSSLPDDGGEIAEMRERVQGLIHDLENASLVEDVYRSTLATASELFRTSVYPAPPVTH